MKVYVKSIRWKRTHDEKNMENAHSPCIGCIKQCEGVDCATLKDWLRGMDEATVEWEADYSDLKIKRMICRTVVWFTFLLLVLVAWKWNGVIGCSTTDTSSSIKCSCKETGK